MDADAILAAGRAEVVLHGVLAGGLLVVDRTRLILHGSFGHCVRIGKQHRLPVSA